MCAFYFMIVSCSYFVPMGANDLMRLRRWYLGFTRVRLRSQSSFDARASQRLSRPLLMEGPLAGNFLQASLLPPLAQQLQDDQL